MIFNFITMKLNFFLGILVTLIFEIPFCCTVLIQVNTVSYINIKVRNQAPAVGQ